MLVCHAAFGNGPIVLWGEELPPLRGRQDKPPLHPFAAHPAALRERLGALGFETASTAPTGLTLLLPTVGDAPLPSSRCLDGAELRPWRVGGLSAPLARAVPWLAARADEPGADGGALGVDLRYWAAASRFALDLIAREQLAPALERRADGDLQAVWRPLFAGGAERRRLRALAEAMPPICRALVPEGDPGTSAVPPGELLEAFLCAALDALARAWLNAAVWPEARWLAREGNVGGPHGAAMRWVEALGAARTDAARLSLQRSGALAEEVAGWTGPHLGERAAFRVCLRLTPPTSDDAPWRLDYFLQATEPFGPRSGESALLVPAAEVWRTGAAAARLGGRRVAEPQELLLGGLGRAARHARTVAVSLEAPAPVGADLTLEEAHAFLREALPALEEEGIGVLVPPWWKARRRRRLGLRLALHPANQSAGTGRFGLQTLVEYDWEVAIGDQTLSRAEFERLAAQKEPLVQLRGEWVELDPAQVEQALRFWRQHPGGEAVDPGAALRLALGAEATGLPIDQVEAKGWVAEALEGRSRLEDLPEPEGFVGQIRPYQRRGFAWLAFMRDHGLGALLADSMGLGKTIQTIASFLHDRARPVLVVCPTSVLGNWTHELARFAPGLRVLVHHGAERADEEAFPQAVAQNDVVLTTYSLLHRDEARLQGVEWAGVVLDEAQSVKNPASRSSRAARKLRAGYRVALTGTPVENRLGELWSILEFLNPGYLGPAEGFRRRYAVPIERTGDQERAEELRKLVAPFILRRLKTDPTVIADLPEKMEIKAYTPLTREQAALYEAVVRDMLARIAESEGQERRGLILSTLTKLKQVCNHPAHYLDDGSPLAGRSGKLDRLEEMLDEMLAAGDQVLVFTQFATFGARLRTYLQERLGREVLYLHGGTPADERTKLVKRFQAPDGPPVFLLSLRAGGLGLNLARANRVVHYDRWWNPAVEAQATDRAYRIGQTRAVQVHAFVCAGTLEERIDELIESKRALAESVVGTGEAWLTELSTDELREVLTLRHAVIADDSPARGRASGAAAG